MTTFEEKIQEQYIEEYEEDEAAEADYRTEHRESFEHQRDQDPQAGEAIDGPQGSQDPQDPQQRQPRPADSQEVDHAADDDDEVENVPVVRHVSFRRRLHVGPNPHRCHLHQ